MLVVSNLQKRVVQTPVLLPMLLHRDANCVATLLHNCATLMLVIVTVVCIYVSLTQIITKLTLLIKLDSVFWIGVP